MELPGTTKDGDEEEVENRIRQLCENSAAITVLRDEHSVHGVRDAHIWEHSSGRPQAAHLVPHPFICACCSAPQPQHYCRALKQFTIGRGGLAIPTAISWQHIPIQ